VGGDLPQSTSIFQKKGKTTMKVKTNVKAGATNGTVYIGAT
jgi:hypothetical protein